MVMVLVLGLFFFWTTLAQCAISCVVERWIVFNEEYEIIQWASRIIAFAWVIIPSLLFLEWNHLAMNAVVLCICCSLLNMNFYCLESLNPTVIVAACYFRQLHSSPNRPWVISISELRPNQPLLILISNILNIRTIKGNTSAKPPSKPYWKKYALNKSPPTSVNSLSKNKHICTCHITFCLNVPLSYPGHRLNHISACKQIPRGIKPST